MSHSDKSVRWPFRPLPGSEEGGGKGAPRRRVLVVDDNADSADTMAMLLQVAGHDVRTAGDGPAAVAAAAEMRPDVVFMGIGLPGTSGYEVARQLKETPGAEKSVLVAMTGFGEAEDVQRSREAGFAHHLVKPVPPEKLERLLAELPAAV